MFSGFDSLRVELKDAMMAGIAATVSMKLY